MGGGVGGGGEGGPNTPRCEGEREASTLGYNVFTQMIFFIKRGPKQRLMQLSFKVKT